MHTKLTLRLDEDLVGQAKDYAAESGRPLSQIVADYFTLLTSRPPDNGGDRQAVRKPTPIVSALRGALRSAGEVDEEDYRRYLEEKYL